MSFSYDNRTTEIHIGRSKSLELEEVKRDINFLFHRWPWNLKIWTTLVGSGHRVEELVREQDSWMKTIKTRSLLFFGISLGVLSFVMEQTQKEVGKRMQLK
jgi:hypothetical protein